MKIYFADIDGTFVKERKIPPVNIEAVKALEEKGHRFVLVSGRGINQIDDILKLGAFECDYIYGNGAGYKLLGEDPVLKYYIHANEYDYWEKLLTTHNAFYIMHTTIGLLMQPLSALEQHFNELKQVYKEIYGQDMADYLEGKKENYYGKEANFAENPFDYLRAHPEIKLIKFELLNGNQHTRETIQKLAREYGYLAFSSVRINLELVPALSNKGSAIKNYLDMFNNVEHTYGFGDALNDVEMFEVVDTSVAVANALDEIKNMCDIVLDEEIGDYILRETL